MVKIAETILAFFVLILLAPFLLLSWILSEPIVWIFLIAMGFGYMSKTSSNYTSDQNQTHTVEKW